MLATIFIFSRHYQFISSFIGISSLYYIGTPLIHALFASIFASWETMQWTKRTVFTIPMPIKQRSSILVNVTHCCRLSPFKRSVRIGFNTSDCSTQSLDSLFTEWYVIAPFVYCLTCDDSHNKYLKLCTVLYRLFSLFDSEFIELFTLYLCIRSPLPIVTPLSLALSIYIF